MEEREKARQIWSWGDAGKDGGLRGALRAEHGMWREIDGGP